MILAKKKGKMGFKKWARMNKPYLIAIIVTVVYTLIMAGIILFL